MNKVLKGSIAGAAGVALLLGGAGTFALWNSTAGIDGAVITAGALTVATANGVWTDQTSSTQAIDLEKYDIVPGDTLTYNTEVLVNAVGDNLNATLSVDKRSILPVSLTDTADVALAEYLIDNTTLVVTSASTESGLAEVNGVGPSIDLTPADGDNTYLVSVTVTFPETVPNRDDDLAKTGVVSFEEFGVTLAQFIPEA
jgi:alternate signal-mediated exported protein